MMLKYIFIIISICFSNHLNGQTFRFGAITGLNICKLSGNDNSGFNYAGFKLGGRIGTDLHRQVRASVDLLYSRKGNIVSQSLSTQLKFKNIRLDYVEIPIIISLMDWMDDPDEEKYYKLHFTFGASFSTLVNYRVRNNLDLDVTDQQVFNKSKTSILGGLVYYPNQHWGINLQYSHSISNLQKRALFPSMKGRNWSLNIIYMMDNNRR